MRRSTAFGRGELPFKRLFQSGSNARFVGVSWYGEESQLSIKAVTPKYYENTENALNTASHLADFINNDLTGGAKYVAAHSLGCMVTAEAIANHGADVTKAFLYDPAIATEGLLPASVISNDLHMEPVNWRPYPEEIKTSEWYTHFDEEDARATLTWRGRVNAAVPKLKVFYSPGEEVLGSFPLDAAPDPGWAANDPQGQYAYVIQAQLKGMLGQEPDDDTGGFLGYIGWWITQFFDGISPASAHGGWRWTEGVNDPFYEVTDGENLISRPPNWFVEMIAYSPNAPDRLKFDPVSGLTTPDSCQGLFDPQNGSGVAAEVWKKHRIIAQMIPERTLSAGGAGGSGVEETPGSPASGVLSLEDKISLLAGQQIESFDMQANRNGWPESRPALKTGNGWRHSDLREVAYLYTYKAWMEPVIDANLNREP